MAIWKFLHITCMFGTVGVIVGEEVLLRISRHPRYLGAIRLLPAWDRIANNVAGPLFIAGVVFGFVTAITAGYSLTAPWLVTAYILVTLMLINGFAVWDPAIRRLSAVVKAESEEEGAVRTKVKAPLLRWAATVDQILWVAIIFTMVVKPFGW